MDKKEKEKKVTPVIKPKGTIADLLHQLIIKDFKNKGLLKDKE
mgnify:CR=1 FL=1